MDNNTPRNISILVYENNKDKITKADNSTQEYIILRNEELEKRNKEFIINIEKIGNQLAEITDENEKQETSLTYMRGLLHNFTEKINLQKKLVQEQKENYLNLKTYTKNVNNQLKKLNEAGHVYYPTLLSILFLAYMLNTINISAILVFPVIDAVNYLCLIALFQIDYKMFYDIFKNINILNEEQNNHKKKIVSFEGEILALDKSNNFIEDHINNL